MQISSPMSLSRRSRPSTDALFEGIQQGDRTSLGRAITLIESSRPDDQAQAGELMDLVLPHTGHSLRIGVTGVPGVGKSTFIEKFGSLIIKSGHQVAVLSIDPSSRGSGGSILGDKTRMDTLARNSSAYVRPSSSGNTLGGTASKTREAMLICEAAGYDVILVETVGVGQSETSVRNMVDFFLLLLLPGGGDELQGIKRGIMEMADAIAVNKADGNLKEKAEDTRHAYENALQLFPPHEFGWKVPVSTCSALHDLGLADLWDEILIFQDKAQRSGHLENLRKTQTTSWLEDVVLAKLKADFYQDLPLQARFRHAAQKVMAGELSIRRAIDQVFNGK